MNCPVCFLANTAGATTCARCGTALVDPATNAPQSQQPQGQPGQQYGPPPPPAPVWSPPADVNQPPNQHPTGGGQPDPQNQPTTVIPGMTPPPSPPGYYPPPPPWVNPHNPQAGNQSGYPGMQPGPGYPQGNPQPPYESGDNPTMQLPYGQAPGQSQQPFAYGGNYGYPGPEQANKNAAKSSKNNRNVLLICGGLALAVAGAAVVVVLFLTRDTTFDAKALNETVSRQYKESFTPTAPKGPDVHCPAKQKVKAGSTFTCTTDIQDKNISITVKDDNGKWVWRPVGSDS